MTVLWPQCNGTISKHFCYCLFCMHYLTRQITLCTCNGVSLMFFFTLHQKWIYNKYNLSDNWDIWLPLAYGENRISYVNCLLLFHRPLICWGFYLQDITWNLIFIICELDSLVNDRLWPVICTRNPAKSLSIIVCPAYNLAGWRQAIDWIKADTVEHLGTNLEWSIGKFGNVFQKIAVLFMFRPHCVNVWGGAK